MILWTGFATTIELEEPITRVLPIKFSKWLSSSRYISNATSDKFIRTLYMAKPTVRHSIPILRWERRFFCINATITVHLLSSSSSSGSLRVMLYCGLCQNVSVEKIQVKMSYHYNMKGPAFWGKKNDSHPFSRNWPLTGSKMTKVTNMAIRRWFLENKPSYYVQKNTAVISPGSFRVALLGEDIQCKLISGQHSSSTANRQNAEMSNNV